LAASPGNKWCTQWLDIPQDAGESLAYAIKNSTAIAVSDSSFQQGHGTAVFVLKGCTQDQQLKAWVISPGCEADQSAYRSAAMTITNLLCAYYNNTEGAIELACNGLSAINMAFSHVAILLIKIQNYDLIAAIRYAWANSPVGWKVRQVKGHQDDTQDFSQLDRWSQLNIIADKMAKDHLAFAAQQQRHYTTANKPWSLWIEGKKLTKNLFSTLYDWVHSPIAQTYWQSKHRCEAAHIQDINWEALHAAMKESPQQRRVFVMKHTVGMCGVGKYMK
jgi:hypothetical protein